MSEENIKSTTTSNYSLVSGMTFFNDTKIKVKFDGDFLSLKYSKRVYSLWNNLWPNDTDTDFQFWNSLFGDD